MARAYLTALLVLAALPASAQQLHLQIDNGLVTMTAANVPVRQVLAEWARIGGTRVVGAERLNGPPLTLTLENVPEGKALDIILRGAAGYVAATRAVPGSGVSAYDRILVLATSAPPANTAPARTAGRFTPPAQEQPEQIVEMPDAAMPPDAVPDMPDPAQNPFAAAFAQPGVNQPFGQAQPFGAQPVPFGQPGQMVPFGQPTPFGVPMAQPNGANGLFVPVQPQPDAAAPPQGFFGGVVGSATPGVIQAPPQAPGQPPRPRQD